MEPSAPVRSPRWSWSPCPANRRAETDSRGSRRMAGVIGNTCGSRPCRTPSAAESVRGRMNRRGLAILSLCTISRNSLKIHINQNVTPPPAPAHALTRSSRPLACRRSTAPPHFVAPGVASGSDRFQRRGLSLRELACPALAGHRFRLDHGSRTEHRTALRHGSRRATFGTNRLRAARGAAASQPLPHGPDIPSGPPELVTSVSRRHTNAPKTTFLVCAVHPGRAVATNASLHGATQRRPR